MLDFALTAEQKLTRADAHSFALILTHDMDTRYLVADRQRTNLPWRLDFENTLYIYFLTRSCYIVVVFPSTF
jgi:hypothetical protein